MFVKPDIAGLSEGGRKSLRDGYNGIGIKPLEDRHISASSEHSKFHMMNVVQKTQYHRRKGERVVKVFFTPTPSGGAQGFSLHHSHRDSA